MVCWVSGVLFLSFSIVFSLSSSSENINSIYRSSITHSGLLRAITYVENHLKIYVYPNPFPNPKCSKVFESTDHYFQFESQFPIYIQSSPVYTSNPEEADLFLVNHNLFCSAYISIYKTRPSLSSSKEIYEKYFNPFFQILFESKYFQRYQGRDHLFVWLSDNGPFCGIKKRPLNSLYPHITKEFSNMIFLTYMGMNGLSQHVSFREYTYPYQEEEKRQICFRPGYDLVLPQYHHFRCNMTMNMKRSIISFFKGQIRLDPICGVGSRLALHHLGLINQHKNQSLISINNPNRKHIDQGFIAYCPSGVGCWSSRLYHGLCSNTIPLIIAREIIEPFERFLNWKSFSIKLDPSDLLNGHFLDDLSSYFQIDSKHSSSSSDSSYSSSSLSSASSPSSSSSSASPSSESFNSTYYVPSKIVQSYLLNVKRVRDWFTWNQTASKSAWKLILIELYCRSKLNCFPFSLSICKHSSSKIANSTYFFQSSRYSRDISLDLISPLLNESNSEYDSLKDFRISSSYFYYQKYSSHNVQQPTLKQGRTKNAARKNHQCEFKW